MTGKGDLGDGAATEALLLAPAGKALAGAVRWIKTIGSQALARRNANGWQGRHHEKTCGLVYILILYLCFTCSTAQLINWI
eukprot:6727397-Ditylum_brightwellii.AAC.1